MNTSAHGYPEDKKRPVSSQALSDEEYARKLQAEEDARVQQSRAGAADSYYSSASSGSAGYPSVYGQNQQQQPQPLQQQQQRTSGGGGLMGKIMGKIGGGGAGHSSSGFIGRPPQPQQQYQQYYPQQQPMYAQQGRPSGGMGSGGKMALGVGGGLLGGKSLFFSRTDAWKNGHRLTWGSSLHRCAAR